MTTDDNIDINLFLSGKKLIGDDYDDERILKWHEEEKDAYLKLLKKDKYIYDYHALNKICGFDFVLRNIHSDIKACGFGSAYGHELHPIAELCSSITLIDSSASFHVNQESSRIRYIQATPTGVIDIPDNYFDLITCFGVLHHIPNVSFMLSELYRCLAPNGFLLIREPTTSMGDWRKERKGVTKNERGIPRVIFSRIILDSGFTILKKNSCIFPPFSSLYSKLENSVFRHKTSTIIDIILCRIFSFNYSYHRTSLIKKFAPASEFYICSKNSDEK